MEPGIARGGAQLRERVALVRREPVFQQVDVVGHALSCFRHLNRRPSSLMLLPLWRESWKLANKNINTICNERVVLLHWNCNFSGAGNPRLFLL